MHLQKFQKKQRDHDFSLIYDAIKRHYPISRTERTQPENLKNTAGFKRIRSLMQDNFLDRKHYKERWENLNRSLQQVTGKPVRSTFSLFNCCHSGEVILEEFKGEDFIRYKTLSFCISVIGPFFSVCGIDGATILLPIEARQYYTEMTTGAYKKENVVTVSPVLEYSEMFLLVEDTIRRLLPGYFFVPYEIGMSTIRNISPKDTSRDPQRLDTIYEALFGEIAIHDCSTRGDERFGYSDWLRPLDAKESKLMKRLSAHVGKAQNDTTIHKVWKLDSYTRLGAVKGVTLIGVTEAVNVIDLTHKEIAIVVSAGRSTPVQVKYRLQGDVIRLFSGVSLKIMRLTASQLVANLSIDFKKKNSKISGEVFEMNFTQMTTSSNGKASA